jgi:ketosteroid isomerase-like protein
MSPFTQQAQAIAEAYLAALQEADLDSLLALFSPDGQVVSPLYGQLPAATFYRALFADTRRSEVSLTDVLTHEARRSIGFLFTYRWTLADGELVDFEVIDYCQLNSAGQITALRIIYDTARTRQAWEESR